MTNKKNKLSAPPAYWKASKREREKIINGCGIKGPLGFLIPDSLLGLSIENACSIHDWQYHYGKTKKQRDEADSTFLENIETIIKKNKSNPFLKVARNILARAYYFGVRLFGSLFFNPEN